MDRGQDIVKLFFEIEELTQKYTSYPIKVVTIRNRIESANLQELEQRFLFNVKSIGDNIE